MKYKGARDCPSQLEKIHNCSGSNFCFAKIWSALTGGEIPVPIPNTVVKPLRADGTMLVRVWESRSVLL
jgi:hypothetical protein